MVMINKDKSIGQAVYIVEGDSFEPNLLVQIYSKLLNYECIRYDKRSDEIIRLQSPINKSSRIIIVTAQYPQVKQIFNLDDYLDKVYAKFSNELNVDLTNSFVYYIFDRDRGDNRVKPFEEAINKLHNSLDNGYEANGLFLPSYPCVEAFLLNSNKDTSSYNSGKDIKEYVLEKMYNIDNLTSDDLITAVNEVIRIINNLINKPFSVDYLDDFADINLTIFKSEEKNYQKNKVYYTLSLIVLSLIDLGIIEI